MTALNITNNKRQWALLLHYAGEDLCDILNTLPDTRDNPEGAIQALNTYFTPKKNLTFETYTFRKMHQHSDETLDTYVTRLRQKASNCEFTNVSREIINHIVEGCWIWLDLLNNQKFQHMILNGVISDSYWNQLEQIDTSRSTQKAILLKTHAAVTL